MIVVREKRGKGKRKGFKELTNFVDKDEVPILEFILLVNY